MVELKDVLMNEFDNRFASKNKDLWTSIESSHPKSEKFLDTTLLMPLYKYSNTVFKFNIHIKQSHSDRSLNASMTEKEKQLKKELNHTNIENKTLKRKLEKTEVKEEQLEVVEQQYVDALDELQKLK